MPNPMPLPHSCPPNRGKLTRKKLESKRNLPNEPMLDAPVRSSAPGAWKGRRVIEIKGEIYETNPTGIADFRISGQIGRSMFHSVFTKRTHSASLWLNQRKLLARPFAQSVICSRRCASAKRFAVARGTGNPVRPIDLPA
jgi:hypothetical protein